MEAVSIARKKTFTSTEVKNNWNAKTYKRYTISLRKKEDAEIIDFIEDHKDDIKVTEIFRTGYETLKSKGL